MQESYNPQTGERVREFFTGKDDEEVKKKMDERLNELQAKGHTFVRRVKIGRNEPCPCGSGKKFKRCHIDKIQQSVKVGG